jgi:hypothetical protein
MVAKYYCPKDCEMYLIGNKCKFLDDSICSQNNPEREVCWAYFKSLDIISGEKDKELAWDISQEEKA